MINCQAEVIHGDDIVERISVAVLQTIVSSVIVDLSLVNTVKVSNIDDSTAGFRGASTNLTKQSHYRSCNHPVSVTILFLFVINHWQSNWLIEK